MVGLLVGTQVLVAPPCSLMRLRPLTKLTELEVLILITAQ